MTTTSKTTAERPIKGCDSCGYITTRLKVVTGWRCCPTCAEIVGDAASDAVWELQHGN